MPLLADSAASASASPFSRRGTTRTVEPYAPDIVPRRCTTPTFAPAARHHDDYHTYNLRRSVRADYALEYAVVRHERAPAPRSRANRRKPTASFAWIGRPAERHALARSRRRRPFPTRPHTFDQVVEALRDQSAAYRTRRRPLLIGRSFAHANAKAAIMALARAAPSYRSDQAVTNRRTLSGRRCRGYDGSFLDRERASNPRLTSSWSTSPLRRA